MCLAILGKIIKASGNRAVVDFGGVKRDVRIDLVDAKIGDYIIVHTGYAIQKMDKHEAKKSLKYLSEILKNAK